MFASVEIILYVRSQSAARDFYAAVLLQNPELDVPGMTEFSIANNVKLGLMPESGIAKIITPVMPFPGNASGVPRCELYLTVESPETYLARCVAAGGTLISSAENRDWGQRVGYAADLDGHVLAFAAE